MIPVRPLQPVSFKDLDRTLRAIANEPDEFTANQLPVITAVAQRFRRQASGLPALGLPASQAVYVLENDDLKPRLRQALHEALPATAQAAEDEDAVDDVTLMVSTALQRQQHSLGLFMSRLPNQSARDGARRIADVGPFGMRDELRVEDAIEAFHKRGEVKCLLDVLPIATPRFRSVILKLLSVIPFQDAAKLHAGVSDEACHLLLADPIQPNTRSAIRLALLRRTTFDTWPVPGAFRQEIELARAVLGETTIRTFREQAHIQLAVFGDGDRVGHLDQALAGEISDDDRAFASAYRSVLLDDGDHGVLHEARRLATSERTKEYLDYAFLRKKALSTVWPNLNKNECSLINKFSTDVEEKIYLTILQEKIKSPYEITIKILNSSNASYAYDALVTFSKLTLKREDTIRSSYEGEYGAPPIKSLSLYGKAGCKQGECTNAGVLQRYRDELEKVEWSIDPYKLLYCSEYNLKFSSRKDSEIQMFIFLHKARRALYDADNMRMPEIPNQPSSGLFGKGKAAAKNQENTTQDRIWQVKKDALYSDAAQDFAKVMTFKVGWQAEIRRQAVMAALDPAMRARVAKHSKAAEARAEASQAKAIPVEWTSLANAGPSGTAAAIVPPGEAPPPAYTERSVLAAPPPFFPSPPHTDPRPSGSRRAQTGEERLPEYA